VDAESASVSPGHWQCCCDGLSAPVKASASLDSEAAGLVPGTSHPCTPRALAWRPDFFLPDCNLHCHLVLALAPAPAQKSLTLSIQSHLVTEVLTQFSAAIPSIVVGSRTGPRPRTPIPDLFEAIHQTIGGRGSRRQAQQDVRYSKTGHSLYWREKSVAGIAAVDLGLHLVPRFWLNMTQKLKDRVLTRLSLARSIEPSLDLFVVFLSSSETVNQLHGAVHGGAWPAAPFRCPTSSP
jgi:hypothetical protein